MYASPYTFHMTDDQLIIILAGPALVSSGPWVHLDWPAQLTVRSSRLTFATKLGIYFNRVRSLYLSSFSDELERIGYKGARQQLSDIGEQRAIALLDWHNALAGKEQSPFANRSGFQSARAFRKSRGIRRIGAGNATDVKSEAGNKDVRIRTPGNTVMFATRILAE
ncbi:hypothetical protein FIBSPDRAFT_201074 [Athelia psychrophila]|uniref:Uncharacterized protein n=1 Tax=Athelia psychrophila TaxID=1759441 RepID=A0A165ZKY1_9AGAM|nr:hypothetical protein FIBSPDRAFT_201074 [Fibularhizoctonia sp. CBS 109695]